jgi:hypothetical protein
MATRHTRPSSRSELPPDTSSPSNPVAQPWHSGRSFPNQDEYCRGPGQEGTVTDDGDSVSNDGLQNGWPPGCARAVPHCVSVNAFRLVCKPPTRATFPEIPIPPNGAIASSVMVWSVMCTMPAETCSGELETGTAWPPPPHEHRLRQQHPPRQTRLSRVASTISNPRPTPGPSPSWAARRRPPRTCRASGSDIGPSTGQAL